MKKIKKISSEKLKNIVKEHFLEDTLLSEDKIDRIIKDYLLERDDLLENEYVFEEKYEISQKSKEVISDLLYNLNEVMEDLDIIKEKESDVIVFNDVYLDEYLSGVVRDLTDTIDDLKYLLELKDNKKDIED